MNAQPRIKIVCEECGSDDVMKDAWAEWDTTAQAWVIHSTQDHEYCNACEGETRLIEQTL